jgi:hypothetical protein
MQEKNKKNNRAAISAEKKLSFKTNLNVIQNQFTI